MQARQAARRRAALYFAAGVAVSYYAHKRRWASRAREAVTPLALALAAYRDAALTSGRVCAALVSDLHAFLSSPDPQVEVPASLRQLLRLVTCTEAQVAVTTLGRSLTDGVASGVAAAVRTGHHDGRALLENVLDAAATEQGRSLLACVVSAAARQAVAVALEASERATLHAPGGVPGPDSDALERILGELDTDRGRRVAQGPCPHPRGLQKHATRTSPVCAFFKFKRCLRSLLACSMNTRSDALLRVHPGGCPGPCRGCRRDWRPGARRGWHLPCRYR